MPAWEDIRIAADVGGTFTDCVLVGADGRRLKTKALTTPENPVQGVLDCLESAAHTLEVDVTDILERTITFVHGTTEGSNALVERRGARTGLLMTKGHEETITIGRVRQKVAGLSEREKIHITHLSKADPPIVHPLDIRPITERIDLKGEVIAPLDTAGAETAINELVETGIEAIAICFLWSFVNPTHEHQVKEIATTRYPDLFVSASVDLAAVFGEYERAVSTVLNAYLGPRVGKYLSLLEDELKNRGMRCSLLVMQSNGGLSPVDAVRNRPLLTVDSGPAGGVLGARYHATLMDESNVICADVGGTTFDVGLVYEQEAQMDPSPVIEQYAYAMSKVYVKSIGAGGGSIAWLDDGGSLRVGPESAGSDPGPACYQRGGTQPTVTDAHLILGYLDQDFPLGGRVRLSKSAAEAALFDLGAKLDMNVLQVAAAIAAISNAQMADLVRKVTVERGLDPREFGVFAYGGAGPVFAAFLAHQIGSSLAYVPADSGVFSALGMLTTDLLFQEERSALMRTPLEDEEIVRLNDVYRDLDGRVIDAFESQGFSADTMSLARSVDIRLAMQVHELEIGVPTGSLERSHVEDLERAFIESYERTYGRDSAYTEAGIEMVTFRSTGTVHTDKPTLDAVSLQPSPQSLIGDRQVVFDIDDGYVKAEIHDGSLILPGQTLIGPAIVQRVVDTVVVPPLATGQVDEYGSLLISWPEKVD